MYEAKIKTLEESFKQIENKINQLQKTENADFDEISKLITIKNRYLIELRDLRKRQWEEDYDRVNFDDDR